MPVSLTVIDIRTAKKFNIAGGATASAPVPEISAEHQRALGSLKFSPEGRKVIEGLYVAEAGLCGTKGSWGVLLNEYITGLQGTNPNYSTNRVKQMLQLEKVTDAVIGSVVRDMTQYRSGFRD